MLAHSTIGIAQFESHYHDRLSYSSGRLSANMIPGTLHASVYLFLGLEHGNLDPDCAKQVYRSGVSVARHRAPRVRSS